MKVYELCDILESIAPLMRQEEWDNCGLMVGEFGNEVSKVLVCLDIDMEIVGYADENGYNFIISHHPLIYKGIRKIVGEGEVQKIIAAAISNKISIYSMHTNYDFADYAMNDHIAELLGVKDIKGYARDEKRGFMIGRTGIIEGGIKIKDLAGLVKEKLHLENVFYSGNEEVVEKILISTGAFDIGLLDPSGADVDVVLSGDIKYHSAKELKDRGILVIDAGHFGTEITFPGLIKRQLESMTDSLEIKAVDFEKDIFRSVKS